MCVNDLWVGKGETRLAKAEGAEPSGQRISKKLHAVAVRSTFQVQVRTLKL